MVGTDLAVIKPILDGFILFPSVVTGQSFYWKHAWVIEDFILPFQDGKGFFGGFVFVDQLVIVG